MTEGGAAPSAGGHRGLNGSFSMRQRAHPARISSTAWEAVTSRSATSEWKWGVEIDTELC